MAKNGIPMGDVIGYGWNAFKQHAALLISVHVVALLVPGFIRWMGERVSRSDGMSFLLHLVEFVVSCAIELGILKIALRIRDGKPVEFANLFDSFDLVGYYLAAAVLSMIATAIGLMLLIVPGIIIAVRLLFTGFWIVDERRGPLDAIQRSWDLSSGLTLDLFLFGILLIAINILGVLLLGVGVLVTLPVTTLAVADLYRRLRTEEAPAPAEPQEHPAP